MRLLLDMNLTNRWVPYLREAGHDVEHWSRLGPITSPDQEICEFAREHGFVLITNDLDFPQILAHTKAAAPSVLLLRGEPLVPETRGPGVLNVLRDCENAIAKGAIIVLDWSGKPRARVLPLS